MVGLLFAMQVAGLLAITTYQWTRRGEGVDVAFYSQALWEIGHGNLDPFSTVFGIPVLHNNLEFILWPLALLEPILRVPLGLLYLQDLAIVTTGTVGLVWTRDLLAQKALPSRVGAALLGLAALATVMDPWPYFTAMYDFHLETFTALAAVLVARELWRGRVGLAALYAVFLASTGLSGLLCLLGFAITAIRRERLFAIVTAISSVALIVLGVSQNMVGEGGQTTAGSFHYLNPSLATPNPLQRLLGLAVHSPEVLHIFAGRLPLALLFLAPVGIIGVAWGRVAAAVLAVFLPPMMASADLFFRPLAAFQVWPATTLVLAGSVELIARESCRSAVRRGIGRAYERWLTFYHPGAWVTMLTVTTVAVSSVVLQFLPQSPAAGAVLRRIQSRMPASSEVVSPTGTLGDFATRRFAYQLDATGPIPVRAPEVDFVFAPINRKDPPALARLLVAVQRSSEGLPGARVVVAAAGVKEVAWYPPVGVTYVTLKKQELTYGKPRRS